MPRLLAPALTAACALVLALAIVLAGGAPLPGEATASASLVDLAPLARVLTQLGSLAMVLPVLGLLCVRRRAIAPLVVLLGVQALEAVLSGPLVRAQPMGLGTASSGQTLTAVLGWGLVALQVPALRSRALAVGVAVGGLVGLSRTALEVHWGSDVLVGGLVGLLALQLARAVLADPPAVRTVPAAPAETATATPAATSRVLRWGRTSPWAWSLTAVAALVPLVPLLLVSTPDRMIDLAVYTGAGGVAGQGGEVYAFRTDPGLPFTYPPFAAALSEPLSRVPVALGQLGWTLASLAALVGVARVAMRPVVDRIGLPVLLALLLVSSPVRSHLRFGQVGLFLVLLVSLDLLRPDSRLRGWGLGLAAAVKLTPAVFLPWLIVTRSWSRLAATVGVAAGATVLGLLVVWPSSPDWLLHALWDDSRFGNSAWPGNQSVRGALLRSGLASPELLWLACAAVLAVVGTLGALRLERAGERLAAVGVLAALSVCVSPISWVHHLVWLVLPLSALVAAHRGRIAAAWAVVLVVPLPSVAKAMPEGWSAALLTDVQGLTAVAAVLLLPGLVLRRPPCVVAGPARARPAPAPTARPRRPRTSSPRW